MGMGLELSAEFNLSFRYGKRKMEARRKTDVERLTSVWNVVG